MECAAEGALRHGGGGEGRGGGRGPVQDREEERGGKEREGECCWKSGGGRGRLYTWARVGLADATGADAIPTPAGGVDVTGPLDRIP